MSQDGVRALLERVESDEAFRNQLLAMGPMEERRRLVLEAGYDVDSGDVPVFKEMVGFDELSDEDLEVVAAAMGPGTAAGIGAGVTVAITAAATAFAVT